MTEVRVEDDVKDVQQNSEEIPESDEVQLKEEPTQFSIESIR